MATAAISGMPGSFTIRHTESDVLEFANTLTRYEVSVCDGAPYLFYHVLDLSSGSSNHPGIPFSPDQIGTIVLNANILHVDVALMSEYGNSSNVWVAIAYDLSSSTGIYIDYYDFSSGTPVYSHGDFEMIHDQVVNCVHIDADDKGNFLVTADVQLLGVGNSVIGLISGDMTTTSSGTPYTIANTVNAIKADDEYTNLSWPDVSLSYCYYVGGYSIFVNNVSACITYVSNNGIGDQTIKVLTAPDFPGFPEMNNFYTNLPPYYTYPYYRYYDLSVSPNNGQPAVASSPILMNHPRITSNVGDDRSWQVVCEADDNNSRNDICMFTEDPGDPTKIYSQNLTDQDAWNLYEVVTKPNSPIANYQNSYPQLSMEAVNGYTYTMWNVNDGTFRYTIGLQMNSLTSYEYNDNLFAITPANNYTFFDDIYNPEEGASVGGRFILDQSPMFYSCYSSHSGDQWLYRSPDYGYEFRKENPNLNANSSGVSALKLGWQNPFTKDPLLKVNGPDEEVMFDISNEFGQVLFSGQEKTLQLQNTVNKYLNKLSSGIYFLNFGSEQKAQTPIKLLKF